MIRYKLRVYRNDCVLERQYKFRNAPPDCKRGSVDYWSSKSRRRLAFVASNTEVTFAAMITLTYPKRYVSDGRTVKRHLRTFLQWLRDTVSGLEYLWFLEFQRRGAPHFHILLNCDLKGLPAKKAISAHWYQVVASEDEKHLLAGTRTEALRSSDGGKRYAVKYAMKMEQKLVPKSYQNVGRFWGHSEGVKPRALDTREFETFGELENSLSDWPYKWHLRNHKVSTLYNATGDLK